MLNAGSGTLSVGSSAANSKLNNTDANITLSGTASRLSGVQTLTVSVGDKTADLSDQWCHVEDFRCKL